MTQSGEGTYRVKEKLEEIKDLKLDLITFEVLRNAFVAACYEASTTIERIAYHPVIGMGRDRSNSILTPDGRLVAHGHTDAAAQESGVRCKLLQGVGRSTKHDPVNRLLVGSCQPSQLLG